jgi:hypothetical protein
MSSVTKRRRTGLNLRRMAFATTGIVPRVIPRQRNRRLSPKNLLPCLPSPLLLPGHRPLLTLPMTMKIGAVAVAKKMTTVLNG